MKQIIDILTKLVSFDTSIERSTLDAVNYVANFFEDNKMDVHLIYKDHQGIRDDNRATIIASLNYSDNSDILLSGHLDTYGVRDQIHNWKTNPFKLSLKNSTAFGRGVVDMKSSIAVSLSLIPFLKQQKKSVMFVFTHDEEGVFSSINQLEQNNFYNILPLNMKLGIVMEPTLSQVKTRHKGYRRYRLHFSDYDFSIVDNVYKYIQDSIDKLHKTCPWQSSEKFNDNLPMLLFKYDLKNKRDFVFQYRYEINDLGEKKFENVFPIFLKKIEIELFRRFGINKVMLIEEINVKPLDCIHPLCSSKDVSSSSLVSYGTEAGYFQKYGIPTIILGAGDYALAHRSNESIPLKELLRYKNALMSIIKIR